MTLATVIDALVPVLRSMLGADWTVSVSDDEWSLLEVLAMKPGSGARAVLLWEDHKPFGDSPRGLAGLQNLRAVAQIQRGMGNDTVAIWRRLLDAEERLRRALLGIVFQKPGDPAWPADFPQGVPPHTEAGQFHLLGSGAYRPPQADLKLEHPAREIRLGMPLSFRVPNAVQRVDLPAGN